MNTKHIYLLITLFLFLGGCNKDDLEDCPIMLHVYFESVMTKYEYENIADQLDLYLYNQNNSLVERFSYSKNQLQQANYTPVLPIWEFGKYTLVALVNPKDYTISGDGDINSFQVALNSEEGDTVRTKQSDLFHAYKVMDLPFTGIINRYDTLDLYKNTNHILVNISFERYDTERSTLHAYMSGNNGSSDYKNDCNPNSKRIYLPYTKKWEGRKVSMQYTTMQLKIGSDLTLYVEEEREGTRTIMKELNIAETISKVSEYNTNEKLDQEDTFTIDLVLSSDYIILDLKINDWYIIRSGVQV